MADDRNLQTVLLSGVSHSPVLSRVGDTIEADQFTPGEAKRRQRAQGLEIEGLTSPGRTSPGRRRPLRVRLPWLVAEDIGAGSLLRRLTTSFGVPPCGRCDDRAEALDQRVVLVASAGPPVPKPGCWFAGTSCYGFIQTLKFCCGDGTEYTERYGWCIGVWFAPPCYPLRSGGEATLSRRVGDRLAALRMSSAAATARRASE
jgi:hypothetical protein